MAKARTVVVPPHVLQKIEELTDFSLAGVKITDIKGKVYFCKVLDPTIMGEDSEAKKALGKGLVSMQDVVTHYIYHIPFDKLDWIVPIKRGPMTKRKLDSFEPFWEDELHQYVANEAKKAQAAMEEAKGKAVPGALFRIGMADGYATYVVTAVKGTQCLVEHRTFMGDDYYDHHFRGGGWFNRKEVEQYTELEYRRHMGYKKAFPST